MLNKKLEFISHNQAAAKREVERKAQSDINELSEAKQADIDYLAICADVELPSWEEDEDNE